MKTLCKTSGLTPELLAQLASAYVMLGHSQEESLQMAHELFNASKDYIRNLPEQSYHIPTNRNEWMKNSRSV